MTRMSKYVLNQAISDALNSKSNITISTSTSTYQQPQQKLELVSQKDFDEIIESFFERIENLEKYIQDLQENLKNLVE